MASAGMHSLMLEKGTIIIPAAKLTTFGDRFMISAFILPDDSKCGDTPPDLNRLKRINVSLSQQPDVGAWPFVVWLILLLAVVAVPSFILRFQFSRNLHQQPRDQPESIRVQNEVIANGHQNQQLRESHQPDGGNNFCEFGCDFYEVVSLEH